MDDMEAWRLIKDENYSSGLASMWGRLYDEGRLYDDGGVDGKDNPTLVKEWLIENPHLVIGTEILVHAIVNESIKIVNCLLEDPRVDPSANNNCAFMHAISFGYVSIFQRLLEDPRIDPSAFDNQALRYAQYNARRWERMFSSFRVIVDILSKDPRVIAKLGPKSLRVGPKSLRVFSN